jgi:EpsI family protein
MRTVWMHYWVAMVILIVAAPLPGYIADVQTVPLRRPLGELTYEIGTWHGQDEHVSDEVRAILGTNDLLFRRYVDSEGQPIGLYVSYFPQQKRGEVSHSPKNCLPGAGWAPRKERRVAYPLARQPTGMINEIVYEKAGRRQLVYYWFQERGRIVASEFRVKQYLIWDAIMRRRTDGALLRISAPIQDSEEATRRRCLAFMRLALPRINESLPD